MTAKGVLYLEPEEIIRIIETPAAIRKCRGTPVLSDHNPDDIRLQEATYNLVKVHADVIDESKYTFRTKSRLQEVSDSPDGKRNSLVSVADENTLFSHASIVARVTAVGRKGMIKSSQQAGLLPRTHNARCKSGVNMEKVGLSTNTEVEPRVFRQRFAWK